jgi:leukotriene-A4 hydrolase
MSLLDPHSYADAAHAKVATLAWTAEVDFTTRTLRATAILGLESPSSEGELDLDSRDLVIESVQDQDGQVVPFELAASDPVLGSRIRLSLRAGTTAVSVKYETSAAASALQWLEPEQTAGGKHPYLFSQCQAIHARSIVPLQDTPSRRITFKASLDVPVALRGLMAAGFVGRDESGARAVERWEMPQPIAPYLFAFAVGDVVSRELGERSRVWAEPSVVERAAWEFAEVDGLLRACESIFGPYAWDRFDILVMPPSFPYGGMENPRLTFVTPTLLAGDRSQVRVIAHELAHAWTGNLVTNANAEHFWLNEGWTRWAELRITERTEGVDEAALLAAICRENLDETIAKLVREGHGEWTQLRTKLEGVDPDAAFSSVPYDKGELFLRAIEQSVGRERFESFAKKYLDTFRFGCITTEAFVELTERELPGVLERISATRWLHEAGLPENAPLAQSTVLDAVVAMGNALPDSSTKLGPAAWNLWLERLPRPCDAAFCKAVDERFHFSASGNLEVKVAFLRLSIVSMYDDVLAEVETVLSTTGRMKYLKPLYESLLERPDQMERARSIFARCAASYHPIARAVLSARMNR